MSLNRVNNVYDQNSQRIDETIGSARLLFPNDNARNIKKDIPELCENDPVYIGSALWYFISDMIESEGDNNDEDSQVVSESYDDYKKDNFLEEVFISEKEYNKIVKLLERKKNLILQGSPGVGKTFMAKKISLLNN